MKNKIITICSVLLLGLTTINAEEISFEQKIKKLKEIQNSQKEYIAEVVAKKTKILEEEKIKLITEMKVLEEKIKSHNSELKNEKEKQNIKDKTISKLKKDILKLKKEKEELSLSIKKTSKENKSVIDKKDEKIKELEKSLKKLKGDIFEREEAKKEIKKYKYKGRFIINSKKIAILESEDSLLKIKEGEYVEAGAKLIKINQEMIVILLEKGNEKVRIKRGAEIDSSKDDKEEKDSAETEKKSPFDLKSDVLKTPIIKETGPDRKGII